MTNTIKDLEERSKKIFNNLGLKDLDIKIWETVNGKTDEKHVHVDKDGVKSDSKSSTDDKKITSGTTSESKAKSLHDAIKSATDNYARKKIALEHLSKWFAGDIDTDGLLDTCKKLFEDRCAKELGSTAIDKLTAELDKTAKTFLSNPSMARAIENLKEIGINISQEDLNEAADQLKKAWGYIGQIKKDNECEGKKDCTCDNSCNKNECKCKTQTDNENALKPMSKAAQIREMLKNARAEEEKKKAEALAKKVDQLKTVIDYNISRRDFLALSGDTGIVVRVAASDLNLDTTTQSTIVVPAVEGIKSEYGFSGYTVDPDPAEGGWRVTFLF